ncbi:hypothetical protein EKO29_10480 [Colwellia sp. Arc7-635]|uniref:hypothetical protein n=1 Tax=Colwellia sp. Arc7-635 TaxID=2497879 RepID=UPI000F854163|nr:hypothetical protein [Colwellia sp. Arc7-635]AZQ84408.1 hypothetical protein EKO29_10480 [Colwellia sp. Arc7-635]
MKKLGIALLSVASFFVNAESLEVDVKFYFNNKLVKSEVIRTETGLQSTITANELLEIKITPEIDSSKVSFSAKLNRFENGVFNKYKIANVSTTLNETAYIVVGREPEEMYKIELVAKKI